MKLTTAVMVLKGVGLIGGAMVSSYVGALAQWANEPNATPSGLQWHIIIGTTLGAGLSSLVAFLSRSYGDWQDEKKGEPHVAARLAGK